MLRCYTSRQWYSQRYNWICSPRCNREFGSWVITAWLYQVELFSCLYHQLKRWFSWSAPEQARYIVIYQTCRINITILLVKYLTTSSSSWCRRLKTIDVPTAALKGAPDFCTVYVISKTKISQVRNASRLAPFTSPIYNQINQINQVQDQFQVSRSTCTSPDLRPKQIPVMRGLYFFLCTIWEVKFCLFA